MTMRFCILALALLAQPGIAADYDWELKRDKDGVQVYTRDVEGSSFKAVKSTMEVDTTLSELTALVRDSAACSEWAAHCAKAEVVEVVSDTEMYVYTLNNMPWPVSDRDAVAHVVWRQDPEDMTVSMTATVVNNKVPKVRGKVRLTYGETGWIFSPTDAGSVIVTSLAHVDPGGAVPSWLSNRLLVDAPHDTMKDMRKLVATGRYKNEQFEFLTDP